MPGAFQIKENELSFVIFIDYGLVLEVDWLLGQLPNIGILDLGQTPAQIEELARLLEARAVSGLITRQTVAGFQESLTWEIFVRKLTNLRWIKSIEKACQAMIELKRLEREIETAMTGRRCEYIL